MKKSVIYVIAVLVLAVSALMIFNHKDKTVDYMIPESFIASFEANTDYGIFGGRLTRTGDLLEFAVTSPEKLKSLEFKLTKEDYKVLYKGINISSESMPEKLEFISSELFDVLDMLSEKTDDIEISGDMAIAEYAYKGIKIICSYDKKTAIPLSLRINGLSKLNELKLSFFSEGDINE